MKSKLLFLIRVLTLLCFPKIIFGQVPNLGITSSFAAFTSIGAFGNIEATNVTGNMGTNAGALTGFPPGILVGQIHIADSITLQATTDLSDAYNNLDALSCDTVIGTTLGDSQILIPKIYCTGAATTLNGNLTLDGQGNPNAIFIFPLIGVPTE